MLIFNYVVDFLANRYKRKLKEENEILESNIDISDYINTHEDDQQQSETKKRYDDYNDYIEYISKQLDNSIRYTEYVAEQMSKTISYSEHIANQIDNSISWREYIGGNFGTSGPMGIPGKSGFSGPSGIAGTSGPYRKKEEKEYNRVYSDIDPYGEENWNEN